MKHSQRGAIHKLTVVVLTLLIIAGVLGFVAYRMSKNDIDPAIQDAIAQAKCDNIDEHLCKFFASWEATDDYVLTAAETENDKTTNYTVYDLRHEDFFLTANKDNTSRETMTVGDHVYIRSGQGAWRQQTVTDDANRAAYREVNELTFTKPENETEAGEYIAAGEEQCDERTCFRYEIAGDQGGKTTYIWFDKDEYRLRRVLVSKDNYSYNATFAYDETVQINEPDQFTIVDNGQHIPPGKTKPTQKVAGVSIPPDESADSDESLPSTGDSFDPEEYRLWLESRRR